MKITNRTKYSTFKPFEDYVSDDTLRALQDASEKEYGGMYDLQFAEFFECVNGDFSSVLGNVSNPTVLQVYWVKRFEKFADEFARVLKGLQIRQSADEVRASANLLKVDWSEGLLVFMQQWFGLHSYKEAEKITVGELLIAKRAAYNHDTYQRALADIQMKKYRNDNH